MARLTPEQYQDAMIDRQIDIVRYINGQKNQIHLLVKDLIEKLSDFCIRRELIETKGQYADCRVYIRKQCILFREKLYRYLEKELSAFTKEQVQWMYEYSPVRLKRADNKKVLRDVFFEAFSDTDTIKSYVNRIANQIFQLWNTQLTIAYRVKTPMKTMVKFIVG